MYIAIIAYLFRAVFCHFRGNLMGVFFDLKINLLRKYVFCLWMCPSRTWL